MPGSDRRDTAAQRLLGVAATRVTTALAVIVGALLLGSVFLPGDVSLAALVSRSDQELTVLVDHPGLRCTTWNGRDRCSASYDVAIGNTGREPLEEVRIVLRGVHEGLEPRQQIQDLSSTNPRAADPELEIRVDDGSNQHLFLIGNLAAGTYLRIYTTDISGRTPDDLGRLTPGYAIQAPGRVVEADPQGATLARMLKGVVGIFL